MNTAALGLPQLDAAAPAGRPSTNPVATPPTRPRPSIAHADKATVRKPRWILGTFWMFWAVAALLVGVTGPNKWLVLVAIGFGAYAVYLYRGGRYGWFFF